MPTAVAAAAVVVSEPVKVSVLYKPRVVPLSVATA